MKLILIAILILGGAFYWHYQSQIEISKLKKTVQEQSAEIKHLDDLVLKEEKKRKEDLQNKASQIQSLREQIQAEKAAFEESKRRLDLAKNKGIGDPRDALPTYKNKLEEQKQNLARLEGQLKNIYLQKQQLRGVANATRAQDSQYKNQEVQRVNELIRQNQEEINHLKDQLTSQKALPFNIYVKGQIKQTENLIHEKRNTQAALREQLKSIKQSKIVSNSVQGQESILSSQEMALKQEIQNQQAYYDQLRNEAQENQAENSGRKQELTSLQSSYNDHKLRLEDLQSQLKSLENQN